MFFSRLDKPKKEEMREQKNCRIIKADKERLDWIFNEYILKTDPQIVRLCQDKKDKIFALTAMDKNENIMGFITAYADEMYAPLDGIQWWIPCIFVYPELRRQGIGSVLVREMIKNASEMHITQLTCSRSNEDETEFWYNNNFDIYFWGANPDTGRRSVSAGFRIM